MTSYYTTASFGQNHSSAYDALIQQSKAQLKAGSADSALTAAQAALKINSAGWEGYTLDGGSLMNLKRYVEAVDAFSKAIERAADSKQQGLGTLRQQCLDSQVRPASVEKSESTATQAEVVLWKTIENSTNVEDFQSYLNQYPRGGPLQSWQNAI